jgi:hypothetical protein
VSIENEALSVGALRNVLVDALDHGGVLGENLHESKDVLLRVDGAYYPLARIGVAFVDGRIALVLTAVTP